MPDAVAQEGRNWHSAVPSRWTLPLSFASVCLKGPHEQATFRRAPKLAHRPR